MLDLELNAENEKQLLRKCMLTNEEQLAPLARDFINCCKGLYGERITEFNLLNTLEY